jgi:hypothetical protein
MRAKDGRLLSIKEVLLRTQTRPGTVDDMVDSLRAASEQEPCSETRLDRETEPDFAMRGAA